MKKSIVLLGMLALTAFLGACGNKSEESTATEEVNTIKIGVMPSTDNIPLIVAHEQGFDKKHGVEIKLETFKSAKDRDAAFQAEEVDGINSDLVAFTNYLQGGMKVKFTSSTYGQFDLVTNQKDADSLKDLKGEQIVIMNNQGPEYSVDQMLKNVDMTKDDVRLIDVPQVPSRLELLKNHQAAAAILPEPFVTMAKAEGMKVLDSTRKIGINPFILCFPETVISEKAAALQGMYDAYNEAVDWLKSHDKEEYIQLFIDKIGFPEKLKEQIEVPDYPHIQQASKEDIQTVFTWAHDKGLLEKNLRPEDVLSDVYFK